MRKMLSILAICSVFLIINTASAAERDPGEGVFTFLPLFIMIAILYFAIIRPINKRKGKSKLSELLVLIPGINALYAIWLASQTDKAILEKIDFLEEKLKKFDPAN